MYGGRYRQTTGTSKTRKNYKQRKEEAVILDPLQSRFKQGGGTQTTAVSQRDALHQSVARLIVH